MTPARATRRRSGWTLGRIAGVELRLHPTFLLLVALAAVGVLGPPADTLPWLAIVFASVVIHELAHSLVARRLGLTVRDIVLLPIGGASEIDDLDRDPRRELPIAAAGPITSFALAGVLAMFALAVGVELEGPSLASGSLLVRAMWANVLLGTFNLLPALPMDGGRVLRSLLATRMSEEAATHRAVAVSRWLAVAMAAVGILVDVFLVLIAAFVYVVGRAEEGALLVHGRLRGLVARDAMLPIREADPRLGTITVAESEPLEACLEQLGETPDGIATVVDDRGAVTGVLLTRRIVELLRP